jgi:type VI secretion system FHA domain protein
MSLTLEVAGPQARKLGAGCRKVFNSTGGSIGRLEGNDWVLPDDFISGRHAVIHFSNGTYFLEDRSSNGVFINSPDVRLPKNQPRALRDGDRIFIDAYEIHVSITPEAASAGSAARTPLGGLFGASPGGEPIPEDPFAPEPAFVGNSTGSQQRPQSVPRAPLTPIAEALPVEERDPLQLLGLTPPARKNVAPRAEDLGRGSPLEEHYRPPNVIVPVAAEQAQDQTSDNLIPEDYDPVLNVDLGRVAPPPPRGPSPQGAAPIPRPAGRATAPGGASILPAERVPPRPAAAANRQPVPPVRTTAQPAPAQPRPIKPRGAEVPPATPDRTGTSRMPVACPREDSPDRGAASTPNVDFAALLAAAGLEGEAFTPELAVMFGSIIRVVVTGMMDLLRARERIKDEFRMHMTTFQAAANNPLKFSANVEDALHNLLVKRNPAYLAPVEAFQDAFQDTHNHQLAMLAGLRAAFDSMLSEFDPEQLQEQFDRQSKKGSLLGAPARWRYWELYQERYRNAVQDADMAFRNLFGQPFAKAYEEQMQRLKLAGRTPPPGRD